MRGINYELRMTSDELRMGKWSELKLYISFFTIDNQQLKTSESRWGSSNVNRGPDPPHTQTLYSNLISGEGGIRTLGTLRYVSLAN